MFFDLTALVDTDPRYHNPGVGQTVSRYTHSSLQLATGTLRRALGTASTVSKPRTAFLLHWLDESP